MPLYMFLRIGSTGIQEASDKQDVENQYNKLSHVHVPPPYSELWNYCRDCIPSLKIFRQS